MRRIFVDTSFYIALLDVADQYHERAQTMLRNIYRAGGVTLVTSEAVLSELLTYFSRFGIQHCALAAAFVDSVLGEGKVACVPLTHDLFVRALDRYRTRLDKAYSHTDCMSFVICEEMKVSEVLTFDRDFEQEGFTIVG